MDPAGPGGPQWGDLVTQTHTHICIIDPARAGECVWSSSLHSGVSPRAVTHPCSHRQLARGSGRTASVLFILQMLVNTLIHWNTSHGLSVHAASDVVYFGRVRGVKMKFANRESVLLYGGWIAQISLLKCHPSILPTSNRTHFQSVLFFPWILWQMSFLHR